MTSGVAQYYVYRLTSFPYYVAAVGAGVSLRLKAVQIIDLKTGGGADASAYGFSATEGFTAPDRDSHGSEFSDDEDF